MFSVFSFLGLSLFMDTVRSKILRYAEMNSVFRASDISDVVMPQKELSRMVTQGVLIRVERGLYSLPETDITENHTLVEAVKLYRGGVVCLISALFFHKIGTQLPYETWLMRHDKNTVSTKSLPVRFVYSTGDAYFFGIEKHLIEGIEVEIYNAAKTVADCFKYRNKIGLDGNPWHESWDGDRKCLPWMNSGRL